MSDALSPAQPSHRRHLPGGWLSAGVVLVLIMLYVMVVGLAPMPAVTATAIPLTISAPPRSPIAWPSGGQGAVGLNGSGVLATNGEQKSVPIASIAKTVLALELLAKQPMAVGQPGTTITFTDADEQLYRDKIKENQSVVPVATNEQLTEYQALQALLLPSGNNIADSLAIRAYGSVANYVLAANQQLANWGLTQTHLDDASGFSPKTVSSAHDLVLLGEKVLANPVLADVVKQSDVTLPVAGLEHNVNTLLGTDNIIGIKTGNTDEAGGCFLFAASNGDGNPAIIGAFLGLPDLATALSSADGLLKASAANFTPVAVAPANQAVATFAVPWGKPVSVVTKSAATIASPTGDAISTSVNIPDLIAPAAQGSDAGQLQAKAGTVATNTPVTLSATISRPPLIWKLLHPLTELRAISAHLHTNK